jgi:hypothetical protein
MILYMSSSSVNAAVLYYLNERFFNFTTVYTNGSVSPLSAGYTFYIPDLQLSFTSNLPPTFSSFTAECYVITEVLKLIQNFPPKYYLIVLDSMSYLQEFNSNPFNSHLSPLILRISPLFLPQIKKTITSIFFGFLVIQVYIVMRLQTTTLNLYPILSPSFSQLLHSDFTPLIKQHSTNTWFSLWNNLPAGFASRYKNIIPNIIRKTWFNILLLHRPYILQFNRLRIGHHLLPSHSFKLGLNDSPFYTLHLNECSATYPIFYLTALPFKPNVLF